MTNRTFKSGIDRQQACVLPARVEDYVGPDNPVRAIESYVSSLDLVKLGFRHAGRGTTVGQPPYHPADLLKLYLYGYLNRVRSSRGLERETHRNLEVRWWLKKLTPDHKTSADFRKDHAQALRQVCSQFTQLCKELELFGGELVAIEGSKFLAVNSRQRTFTQAKLQRVLQELDQQLTAYLSALAQGDQHEAETASPPAAALQSKLARLRARRARHQEIQGALAQSGESQISLTDPDSRSLLASQRTVVAYNVQIAADAKHKVIVEHEVT